MFILGILVGISISILIYLIVIIKINGLSIANLSKFSRDFPTWRGIAIWIFYVWIIGWNVHMYSKFRIRYRELFKVRPDYYPRYVNIYKVAGFFSSLYIILFLFYILDMTNIYDIPGFGEEYFALIIWGMFAGFLFLPLPILFSKGRFFFFNLIVKMIVSPFTGMTFAISWFTNQGMSMTVPLRDLHYTVCYYTQIDSNSPENVCL